MNGYAAVAALASSVLLMSAADVQAQLTAAKDGAIVYGHHHLNVTNVDAQKKFFVETLGGVPIKVGTNNLEIVKFPNVFIFFRQVQAAPGGTRGTVVNHIGFSVPNLRAAVDPDREGHRPAGLRPAAAAQERGATPAAALSAAPRQPVRLPATRRC